MEHHESIRARLKVESWQNEKENFLETKTKWMICRFAELLWYLALDLYIELLVCEDYYDFSSHLISLRTSHVTLRYTPCAHQDHCHKARWPMQIFPSPLASTKILGMLRNEWENSQKGCVSASLQLIKCFWTLLSSLTWTLLDHNYSKSPFIGTSLCQRHNAPKERDSKRWSSNLTCQNSCRFPSFFQASAGIGSAGQVDK